MRGKSIYIVSAIIIALPWIFLLELLPIPYDRISTLTEIIIECVMFTALLVAASLLRRELKRQKQQKNEGAEKSSEPGKRWMRVLGRVLLVLVSLTSVLMGLILLLIGISFSL